MKKIKIALCAIIASIALVSCGVDSKLDKLEKACNDKDYVKFEQIAADLEKSDLTKEQQDRFDAIAMDCALGAFNDAFIED